VSSRHPAARRFWSRPAPWTALALALSGGVVGDPVATAADGATPPFRDVAARSGLAFRHSNGFTGRRYIVEIMGSGCGFLDYDGDGDMDALLLNGGPLPGTPPQPEPLRNRLFRNDGSGSFEDVTDAAGLGHEGFGMGMAVGDIDNDGDSDLLVTNYGPDVLYRNRGDGTFEDITEWAGVGDERWTTSATFIDYDLDGDLDLYVAGYVDFDPARFEPCRRRGAEFYCAPDRYSAIPDRLYRNGGNGRFTDISEQVSVMDDLGKGLGVVAGDVDDDGDQDLYVANDATANFLFLNRLDTGSPGFIEEALFSGVAYGQRGVPEGGMGTDMGDFDGDGDLDIFCNNLEAETSALYRNDGLAGFLESSYAAGIAAKTLPWVAFGTKFLDHDLDGDLDLFVTNGHILDNPMQVNQWGEFEQDDMLFENVAGQLRETCPGCWPKRVGRGLATGDMDGDGDLDILINNLNDAPSLLENVAERGGVAIGLRLQGNAAGSNRDAYGARVTWQVGGATHLREAGAGGSYCSSSDPRLLLMVPKGTERAAIAIRWPDGSHETHQLAPGAYHHLVQGEGVRASTPFRVPPPE